MKGKVVGVECFASALILRRQVAVDYDFTKKDLYAHEEEAKKKLTIRRGKFVSTKQTQARLEAVN